jgi:WD40 repeat protein
MLKLTDFTVFNPPSFLKTIELKTPGLDHIHRLADDLVGRLRSALPNGDLDLTDTTVRSPVALFALIEADRGAELSILEWLLVLWAGAIWDDVPQDKHESIAQKVWQFIRNDEPLIPPALCSLAQSSQYQRPTLESDQESSATAFLMPIVLQRTILTDNTSNARVQDQLALIRKLMDGHYLAIFHQAHVAQLLPRGLFRAFGLPTQLRSMAKVEGAAIEWFQLNPSPERCDWLLRCFDGFTTTQVHRIASDLLCRVSPEVGSDHATLRRWLEQRYWYRSAEGREGWEFLSEAAKEALPRWLSIGGWSDLKGAIALIQPQLSKAQQNQLEKRPQFWSHYTSRFDRVRILFCNKSYCQLSETQQRLFECLEPSEFSENTELCVFDFRNYYIVEILRGEISETRIFPQTEDLEQLLFRSSSLSLLEIRQQSCDLKTQTHDHKFLWQGYMERWLRGHGIMPNDGIKDWQGLPPEAARYDPLVGLPEASASQRRIRDTQVAQWWSNLQQLQAKIMPGLEPKVVPAPVVAVKRVSMDDYELVQTLEGHSASVRSVSISPDGGTIVSGSCDNTIKIWNMGSGELRRTLEGHSGWVQSVSISPDGGTIVSGSSDETIKIWDMGSGELRRTLKGHSGTVYSVSISPDGGTIVSGSYDNTIKIWDMGSGELHRTLQGHSGSVFSVSISPDGGTIVSGSSDETIKIWDMGSGELHRTLEGHSREVNSVSISPDGGTIVSGSPDKTIKIWRLRP